MDEKNKLHTAAFAVLLAFSAAVCFAVFLPHDSSGFAVQQSSAAESTSYTPPKPVLFGAYDVVRVVDGDTIIVSIDGNERKVRMIGIDTPESVHPDQTRNTDQGKIAADFTAELLTGKQVYLEYDTDRTDDYGRILAYVWLDGCMVEDMLLQNGLAETMRIAPNTKYALHFSQIEQNAQENRAGFWQNDS